MKKTCENCWMDRIINWMTILTIQHNTTQWNIIEMCRKCRLAHHACTTSASLSSDSAFQISEYSVTIRIIFQWLSTGILTRSISCFTIEDTALHGHREGIESSIEYKEIHAVIDTVGDTTDIWGDDSDSDYQIFTNIEKNISAGECVKR